MKILVFIAAIIALASASAVPSFAQPPNAEYFLQARHKDNIPLQRYAERRRSVLATMSPKSLAVFVAADVRNRQNDVDYEYRQSSDFLYLCGFPEAESVLMLIPGGLVLPKALDSSGARHEALLFVKKRDLYLEMRSGSIIGADRATALFGVKALENANFASGRFYAAARYGFCNNLPHERCHRAAFGRSGEYGARGTFALTKAVSTRPYPLSKAPFGGYAANQGRGRTPYFAKSH